MSHFYFVTEKLKENSSVAISSNNLCTDIKNFVLYNLCHKKIIKGINTIAGNLGSNQTDLD
jgi:hypothetical protein